MDKAGETAAQHLRGSIKDAVDEVAGGIKADKAWGKAEKVAGEVPATPTPRTVFVVDADRIRGCRSYHYFCGACGASLLDRGTPILRDTARDTAHEIFECVFYCCACRTINEAPVGRKMASQIFER